MSPPPDPKPAPNAQAQAMALIRLGHLQVAILDVDIQNAQMVRGILGNLRITQTFLSRSSQDMISILAEKPVDVLITEWDCRPESGLDLTRFLRSPESPNRMLPVLLTTSRDASEHGAAFDAGVNEIIPKPFNVRAILNALTTVIDQPRPFILAPGYTGPDRRRGGGIPPDGVEERRRPEVQPQTIAKVSVNEVFADGMPRVVPPDFSLKQKLEAASVRMAGIDSILPQAEVNKRSDDFVQWMLTDVQTIRQSLKNAINSPDNSRRSVDRLVDAANAVRSRSMRSGYTLAAKVTTGLVDFCQKRFDSKNAQHALVVEKHIETLQAILNARLTGDDNPLGRQLLHELQVLIKKYV